MSTVDTLAGDNWWVGPNFLACDRDQQFLMPPSVAEWLAEDHLAWFVLDVVDELDLDGLYAGYRADGWGHPAHEPSMMLALLLYAYCLGERSSRRIEARCRDDVAFRVITANSTPDHATIARFRVRHEDVLKGLLVQSLRLCQAAGLVRVGVVALDGTKIAAQASMNATRSREQIEAEVAAMLAEAAAVDAAEALDRGRCGDRRSCAVDRWLGAAACWRPRLSWRPRIRPRSRPTSARSASVPPGSRPPAGRCAAESPSHRPPTRAGE
jgi:transposase